MAGYYPSIGSESRIGMVSPPGRGNSIEKELGVEAQLQNPETSVYKVSG